MKILHFADAHIDMANYGRHDPETGLPFRVLDFLKSLDTIIDAAIQEKVDLVLFAGDAYKDRTPAPTFQREWGRRIMRLSKAGIPTLLLIGNHDVSPASGRAFSFQEFDTLEVPHVQIISRPGLLTSETLEGLPVQIIALPWVNRSSVAAALQNREESEKDATRTLEEVSIELVERWLTELDPNIPTILLAHASIEGAIYGGERSVMLGGDFTLPRSLVRDKRLDYVAMGHIHKKQDVNEGAHPPVVYPGSIERVDFGEAGDDKYFVIAEVKKNKTLVDFRQLTGIRPFITCEVTINDDRPVTDQLIDALPSKEKLTGAVVRLIARYPREKQAQIDEKTLREYASSAFEFHFVPRPEMDIRVRLAENQAIASLSPADLAEIYWKGLHLDPADIPPLVDLVNQIMTEADNEEGEI
jgi:DNA repair protein SbcD/Mre11